jgi:hypothetical protein
LKQNDVKDIYSPVQILQYQQQWIYDSTQKNNQAQSEFQHLLEVLHRIETKLDVLLMNRNK